jgi:hypothetical protein
VSSIASLNEIVAASALSTSIGRLGKSSCCVASGKIISLWVILCNLGTILVRVFSISGPAKGRGNLIVSLSPADMSSNKTIAWVLPVDGLARSNYCIALGMIVSLL